MKCKLIQPDTDLSNISIYPMEWDTYVGDVPVSVYAVGDFYHTYGGRYGNNNLYACPRDQKPSSTNLIPFDGQPVNYGLTVNEHTYFGKFSIDSNYFITITRNGNPFYSFTANDQAYGMAKAYILLNSDIQEGPINFNRINWLESEILGRNINYEKQPYTVYYCNSNLTNGMLIIPGHLHGFALEKAAYKSDSYTQVDVFSEKIEWL